MALQDAHKWLEKMEKVYSEIFRITSLTILTIYPLLKEYIYLFFWSNMLTLFLLGSHLLK